MAATVTIDVQGVGGPARYAAAVAGRVVFASLELLEESKYPEPQLELAGGFFNFTAGELQATDEERRDIYRSWLLAHGFQDILRGIKDSLEEAYVVSELLALSGKPLPDDFGSIVGAKRKKANGSNFPTLLAWVNARLKEPLNFSEEIKSLQAARNCLEHRRGIVQDIDTKGADRLILRFPVVEVWVQRNDGQQERVEAPIFMEKGEGLGLRLGSRVREVPLGERLQIAADEFGQVAAAIFNFADELVSRLPDPAHEIIEGPHRQPRSGRMENEPEQEALFYIEGPDEDGCVWISSTDEPSWHHNLGPADKVAEVLSQWLASIDDGESAFLGSQDE